MNKFVTIVYSDFPGGEEYEIEESFLTKWSFRSIMKRYLDYDYNGEICILRTYITLSNENVFNSKFNRMFQYKKEKTKALCV